MSLGNKVCGKKTLLKDGFPSKKAFSKHEYEVEYEINKFGKKAQSIHH